MNSEAEKLCLKLTDFQENAALALKTLREDKEFADVTLACEDGQQVEAHKVILASSSPFFLNLLRMNNHPHPLIYMRGIKSEDLLAAVDFLYFGAANIREENLESFLALAEELQLKGLVGSGTEEETEEADIKPSTKQETPEPEHLSTHEPQTPDISTSRIKVETSPIIEETEVVANYTVATDLQNLDEKVSHTCHICGITVSKYGKGKGKGLAQHIRWVHPSEEETKETNNKPSTKQETSEHLSTYEPQPDISNSRLKVETSPIIEETETVANYTVAADLQNLDEKVKSMMETKGNRDRNHKFARRCKVCGKEGPYGAMRDHIEAHHITGVSHTCHICGITVSKSRKGLAQHIRRVHASGY